MASGDGSGLKECDGMRVFCTDHEIKKSRIL
jgi:hypothetical protein